MKLHLLLKIHVCVCHVIDKKFVLLSSGTSGEHLTYEGGKNGKAVQMYFAILTSLVVSYMVLE